jgi:hypothetical protein
MGLSIFLKARWDIVIIPNGKMVRHITKLKDLEKPFLLLFWKIINVISPKQKLYSRQYPLASIE